MDKKRKRVENKLQKVKSYLELLKKKEELSSSSPAKKPRREEQHEESKEGKGEVETKPKEPLTEEYARLRAQKIANQKASMQKPKLYLTLDELFVPTPAKQILSACPSLLNEEERSPLFVMDIQHLLLYSFQGMDTSYAPRWCKLLRWPKVPHVITVIVDNVSALDYKSHTACFPFMQSSFHMQVEIKPPALYGSSVLAELTSVPMSFKKVRQRIGTKVYHQLKQDKKREDLLKKKEELAKKREEIENEKARLKKELEEKLKGKKADIDLLTKSADIDLLTKPADIDQPVEYLPGSRDKFPRTELLLSPQQMIAEKFIMPTGGERKRGFIYSKPTYANVTDKSPMFALDCEMCMTTLRTLEVTHVSMVNEKLECVYDSLVKPDNRITDYLTQFSGITKEMMDTCYTRLADAQIEMSRILPPDAILVGQSLSGDLKVMKMYHPYVIDTSVIYNLTGQRSFKTGLKKLMANFLGKTVQAGNDGHSPIEDSASALELVLHKLTKYPEYGDMVMGWDFTWDDAPPAGLAPPTTNKTCPDCVSNGDKCNKCANLKSDTCPQNMRMESAIIQTKCEKCIKDMEESPTTRAADKPESRPSRHAQIGSKPESNMAENANELKCTCTTASDENAFNKEVEQRSVFFNRPGVMRYTTRLVDELRSYSKSVHLVGDNLQFEEDVKCAEGGTVDEAVKMHHSSTDSNKAASTAACQSMSDYFFTMVALDGSAANPGEKEDKFKQLDGHLKDIVSAMPENALMCVLFAGKTEQHDIQDGLCFVKLNVQEQRREKRDIQ